MFNQPHTTMSHYYEDQDFQDLMDQIAYQARQWEIEQLTREYGIFQRVTKRLGIELESDFHWEAWLAGEFDTVTGIDEDILADMIQQARREMGEE